MSGLTQRGDAVWRCRRVLLAAGAVLALGSAGATPGGPAEPGARPVLPLVHLPLDDGAGETARGRGLVAREGRIVSGYWSQGPGGVALDFNGRTTRVEVPHDPRLNAAEALTLSAWVYLVDPNGARGLISKGRGSYSGYTFSVINGSPTFEAYLDTGKRRKQVRVSAEGQVPARRWTHVAARFDGQRGEVTFFVDGGPAATRKVPAGRISYSPPLGDYDYPNLPLTVSGIAPFPQIHYQLEGFVREVKLWGVPLADEVLRREHAAGKAIEGLRLPTRREVLEAGYDSELSLQVTAGGSATPAKVTLTGADGRRYAPRDSFDYGDERRGHFYAFGPVRLPLPAGRYEITVQKGFEFEPRVEQLELKPGERRKLDLGLSRWVDLPARGWYCGDEELQAIGHTEKPYDRRLTGDQIGNAWKLCMAEGLNWFHFVGGMEQAEGRPAPGALAGSGREAHSRILGDVVCLNAEPRRRGLFGQLETLAEVEAEAGAATFAESLHEDVGKPVLMTSPRGLPVAAALGKAHLWRYAFDGAEPIGYRLLNLGIRMAATGGTDTYLNNPADPIAPGAYRVYTRLDRLDWPSVKKAYREQQLFASKGPWVLLRAETAGHGQTLKVAGGQRIACRIEAGHVYGVERVELIYNGKVAHSWSVEDAPRTTAVEHLLRVEGSGWIAARVTGKRGRFLGTWAHTAPIYLQVPGRSLSPAPADARYFIGWLDRFDHAIVQLAQREGWPEQDYGPYRAEIARARAVYVRLAGE